jgi:phosphohistidine phosphatase
MKLYFFRHGIAQPHDLPGLPDHQRQLTDEGFLRTRRSARLLKLLDLRLDRLYSSPLIRARQTADVIGQTLGIAVQIRDEVAPGFNLTHVETLTRDMGSEGAVMFIGHEPDLSATISALIGGGSLTIKKGALARVDVQTYIPLRGQLTWLLNPKIFEEFG